MSPRAPPRSPVSVSMCKARPRRRQRRRPRPMCLLDAWMRKRRQQGCRGRVREGQARQWAGREARHGHATHLAKPKAPLPVLLSPCLVACTVLLAAFRVRMRPTTQARARTRGRARGLRSRWRLFAARERPTVSKGWCSRQRARPRACRSACFQAVMPPPRVAVARARGQRGGAGRTHVAEVAETCRSCGLALSNSPCQPLYLLPRRMQARTRTRMRRAGAWAGMRAGMRA